MFHFQMFFPVIILMSITALINAVSSCSDVITLKQGQLTGIESKSVLTGVSFCSYLGIPYAERPVENLRFQETKAHEGWTGVYEAKNVGNRCVQRNPPRYVISGNEDCLFLNIYTPEPPSKVQSPKAVMVFIHGGSFKRGSGESSSYSPDYLMNHDVVIVTINYRLDVLGFLDLGLTECPGNVGMKDQAMALQWVKENIELFGGDPNNVTIFGTGSGSTSVYLHRISPFSKGLFQKCIMESGNSIDTNLDINEADEVAQELKTVLGFDGNGNADFLYYLKNLAVDVLLEASENVVANLYKKHPGKSLPNFFIPAVEKLKENSFLPESPSLLSTYADPVPIIVGLTNLEFTMLYASIQNYLTFEEVHSLINNNLIELMRENLIDLNLTEELLTVVTSKVKEFYFNNESVDENSLLEIVDLYSDLRFVRNFYKSLDSSLKSNEPVYVYQFSFIGKLNFGRNILSLQSTSEQLSEISRNYTTHMDEIGYLFYQQVTPQVPIVTKADAEYVVIDNMCKLWTNFAKTGNPSGDNVDVKWSPTNRDSDSYLIINENIREEPGKIFANKLQFWEQF